jgi:hypothetical protein
MYARFREERLSLRSSLKPSTGWFIFSPFIEVSVSKSSCELLRRCAETSLLLARSRPKPKRPPLIPKLHPRGVHCLVDPFSVLWQEPLRSSSCQRSERSSRLLHFLPPLRLLTGYRSASVGGALQCPLWGSLELGKVFPPPALKEVNPSPRSPLSKGEGAPHR